jgi:hypothetical protein
VARDAAYNLYELLGVAPTAGAQEVTQAYKARLRTVHPDMGGSAGLFGLVQGAYGVLGDPAARASYDASLRAGTIPSSEEPEPERTTPDDQTSPDPGPRNAAASRPARAYVYSGAEFEQALSHWFWLYVVLGGLLSLALAYNLRKIPAAVGPTYWTVGNTAANVLRAWCMSISAVVLAQGVVAVVLRYGRGRLPGSVLVWVYGLFGPMTLVLGQFPSETWAAFVAGIILVHLGMIGRRDVWRVLLVLPKR